ncbi:MAG: ComEC/Rec2 family competence protein [Planctomycetes bacterium]|nr:ComEC/Rec2 family competence protein [Planctomycetota bacterium]
MFPIPHSMLALGAAVGAALVAVQAPPSPTLRALLLVGAAALALTRLAPLSTSARWLLALGALVAAGAGEGHAARRTPSAPGLYRVVGHIVRVDPPREHFGASAALLDERGNHVELRFEDDPPRLRAGERWSALGRLLAERELVNFDTRPGERGPTRLLCSGAALRRESGASLVRTLAEDLRLELTRRIDALFPPAQRGLAQALLLGHSRAIEPEHRERLRATGTAHLIAVSGAHVMLFLALPLLLFRAWRRCWRVPALALLVVGYTLITGGAAPVRRAAVLVATQLACDVLGRPHRGSDALAWAAVIELACAPEQILDLSFLLSYLAVAGLLLALREAPAPTTWAKRVELALRVGLGATAATMPLLHYTFGTFSPHTLWLSPIGSPLLACSMALGYLGLALSSTWLACAAAQPLVFFDALLVFADELAGTPIGLGAFPLLASTALSLATLAALAGARRAAQAAALVALLIALGASWPAARRASEPRFFVEVLDVGHGTCVLLGEPHGAVALFDAGSRHAVRRAGSSLRARLDHYGAREILFVAISHHDDDHRNLLREVAGLPPVRTRIGPPGCPEVDQELCEGMLRFELGAAVVSLHAPRSRIDAPTNDRSLWMRIELEGHRLLLFGDSDWLGLAELLDDLPRGCDALLWPHHGRTRAGARALVARAQPGAIWISDEQAHAFEGLAGAIPVLATAERGALLWTLEEDGSGHTTWARAEPR